MAKKTKYICPSCGEDMRETGIYTLQEEVKCYKLKYNPKNKSWDYGESDTDSVDGETCYCRECDEELDFNPVWDK